MNSLLYYILGCTVNRTSVDALRLKDLTAEGWGELFLLGKKQGVTGVLFEQIQKLPKEVAPPRELLLRWMSHTMSVEHQTKERFQKSAEFAELMYKHGLHTLVLKGLALSGYYPNPWHREYGDLDCYLYEEQEGQILWTGCYERGNQIAEQAGLEVERDYYKHSHIKYKGLEVENHQFSLPIRDGEEVRALERELRRLIAKPNALKRIGKTQLMMPPADFNALFFTAHAMSHFLFESIRVRHVLNWAMFLKREQDQVDWNNFWMWCDKMHYTRFVKCLNYICSHYLEMELSPSLKVEDSAEIARLSERVMQDIFSGYSIYTTGHTGLQHRYDIAVSYLRGLWKFRDVYQRNAFWLLLRRVKNFWIKDVKL